MMRSPFEVKTRGEDSRYIVFGEKLAELHNFRNQCGSPVVHKEDIKRGKMIGFRIACHQGHEYTLHSQPYQNDMPLGNLLIAAALMITGARLQRSVSLRLLSTYSCSPRLCSTGFSAGTCCQSRRLGWTNDGRW